MFKKDDYIVCLKGDFTNDNNKESTVAKENYIIKQYATDNYLRIYVGLDNFREKGNQDFTFDKKRKLQDWRYATKEEIEHYDKIGKPYDVTTLESIKPKNLDKKDLQLRKYYYNSFNGGTEYIFELKTLNPKNNIQYFKNIIDITGNSFNSVDYNNLGNILREATEEEIKWLDACIKANKFISKEEALKVDHNLIVGNWYSIENSLNYRKIKSIYKDRDCITYSECITQSSGYTEEIGTTYGLNRLSLVSQEELNKYLPDGHPDKTPINECTLLPINRYLKALVNNPVGMGSVIKGDYVFTVEGGCVRDKNNKLWGCSIYNHILKGELELMPEGFNPNTRSETKVITSFKDYKIGDKIKPIISGGNDSTHRLCKKAYDKSAINNSIFEIESFELDTNKRFIVAVCKEGYVLRLEQLYDYFEKVEEEWIPKVDDWVVITTDHSGNDIGTVIKVKEIINNYIRYDGVEKWTNCRFVCPLKCVRKALAHEIPIESRFYLNNTPSIINYDSHLYANNSMAGLITQILYENKRPYIDSFKPVKLLVPDQNNTLDTKVNKVKSVSVELVEANKVVLF